MKLLFTGDWQLEANPPHDKTDESGRSVRFQENIDTISTLISKASDLGCTGMVHLGDLTENKNPKSVELEAAASLFNMAFDSGMKIWAIAGNHDGSLFELSSSSFSALALMARGDFRLFHQIEIEVELGMLAIPYRHKLSPDQVRSEIRAVLSSVELNRPIFAAAHYGIQGVTSGPRNLLLQGDKLTADDFQGGEPRLAAIDTVFCGHIHKAQIVKAGTLTAVFPGSPVICDQGERVDEKTFVVYDTITKNYDVHQVPQLRRWLQIPYNHDLFIPPLLEGVGDGVPAPWGPDDIVTVTGEYDKPDFPRDTIEAAVKAGMSRPFSLELNVKPRKAARELRGAGVDEGNGMRDNMVAFMKEKYPRQGEEPGRVAPAGDLALSLIEEQEGKKFCARIYPLNLSITNFMTFERYESPFQVDVPTLIYGQNGIGKTTKLDAILWCLTGQTSKGVASAGVVRQEAKEAIVELILQGDTTKLFKVRRSVKLSKTGKPTQALSLAQKLFDGADAWLEIGDGGVIDTQLLINRLVGGSFNSLRVTNFKFQNDTNPIVRATPADRKKVLTEILGLEPLSRAFKAVTERRQESQRALDAEKNKLGGMVAAYDLELMGKDQAVADVAEFGKKLEVKLEEEAKAFEAGRQADERLYAARAAVDEANGELADLPNTEANLAAAEQAIVSAESAHQLARDEKAKRWARVDASVKEVARDLERLEKEAISVAPAEVKELEGLEVSVPEAATTYSQAVAAANGKLQHINSLKDQMKPAHARKVELAQQAFILQGNLGLHVGKDVAYRIELEVDEEALKNHQELQSKMRADLAASEADSRNALVLKKKLVDGLAGLQGKDIGKCARCGQAVDSAHIEKELAESKRELELVETTLKSMAGAQMELQSRVATTVQKIAALEQGIKQRRQLLDQLQVDTVKLEAVRKSVAEIEVTCTDLVAAIEAAEKDWQELDVKAATRKLELGQLEVKKAALGAKVKAAAAWLQSVELKKQAQAGLATQLQQIADEGLEANSVFEVKKLQLQAVRDQALEANKANLVVKAERRAVVEKAMVASAAAGEAARAAASRLADLAGDVRVIKANLSAAQGQLDRLERQKAQVDQARLQLAMAEEKVEIEAAACALLDPREGLPVYLIDRQLPFLEDRINLYLDQLGIQRMAVELTTLDGDRETLAILVDNGKSPRLDIAAFSGGQLDRIEIALKWALSDLSNQMRGVTFGLLAYDEPTGGLDEAGKAGLIKLLFERCASTCPVTLVVSHDVKLIQSFDHKLQFTQGAAEQTVVQ